MSLMYEEYNIHCNLGILIVRIIDGETDFWLRNNKGVSRHCIKISPRPHQLKLPFTNDLEVNRPAESLIDKAITAVSIASRFFVDRRKILQLCISGELRSIELVENCPALAFLIAQQEVSFLLMKQDFPRKIKSLLKYKQKDILLKIGWPGSRWIVKLLRKVPASHCCREMFMNLRKVVETGETKKLKTLQHLPTINRIVVRILSDPDLSPYFKYSFYEEVCIINAWDNEFSDIYKFLDCKKQLLDTIQCDWKIPVVSSLEDLKVIQEKIDDFLMSLDDDYYEVNGIVFSPPPIPQLELGPSSKCKYGIFPLTTGSALIREGCRMNHCIASFAENIQRKSGQSYVYHVNLPGEMPATVLVRQHYGKYQIEEIRGQHNSDVSTQLEFFVSEWLAGRSGIVHTFYKEVSGDSPLAANEMEKHEKLNSNRL